MPAAKTEYDAIVVGSGPNGLAAAITMQQQGLSVLLIEAKDELGGGLRSAELTLPGFVHDVCSAVHPLAVCSPFFQTLPLERHGLQFVHSAVAAAHPFDDGSAAALYRSLSRTAAGLGNDRAPYLGLLTPVVSDWPELVSEVLGPLHFPGNPLPLVRFGWNAIRSASHLSHRFHTRQGKGFWAGMTAHSMQDLSNATTSAIGLVLLAAAHTGGWPVARGGSASIARALTSYFVSLGGALLTGFPVRSLSQLPSAKALLLDVTPKSLLEIAGHRFSSLYSWQLRRYRYGMGVFKIDWALDDAIPFTAPECREAGTLHLGNTWEEIADSERATAHQRHPERPFVLLAQQSLADPTRAPEGKHTAWAYCHVPHGSTEDMTARIEKQVERFAPGFRERILARHVMNTVQMEEYNANYVGGDINGGVQDAAQLFTRPALRLSPYRTSTRGIYICSSSTPPGGGVHGMCGYHAARRALKDVFGIEVSLPSINGS